MFRSLYAKLALALSVLFVLLGIVFVALMSYSTEMYQQEVSQKLNRELAAHIVKERLLFKQGRIDPAALEQIFHTFMVVNPSVELYLLDPQGKVLAFSTPSGKVQRHQLDMAPVHRFLAGTQGIPLLGDDPRAQQRQKVFSVAPISEQGIVRGYLYIILGGEQYAGIAQRLQGSYIFKISLWMVIAGIVFILIAGLLLFALLTRRLRSLSGVMQQFKQNDFTRPAANSVPGSHDEISDLENTFKEMADCISEQMAQLKQTDTLRRELIANVSHDLRTPLASLQGYLETLLLKQDQLSEEERQHYLAVAAKHSRRLGQLITELFELAKLDSNETRPKVEPFSLDELVSDIVQKFHLRASEHGVTIALQAIPGIPFVAADIGLIERVLENLIENALHYTPSGGHITVVLIPAEDKVTVQVVDTGCGISQQDLPNIFDRFYRVKTDKQQHENGSGLGLAIAKRILELHGSFIRVSSALNAGTTFSFQLPIDRRLET